MRPDQKPSDYESYKRFLMMTTDMTYFKEISLESPYVTVVYCSYADIDFVASFNRNTGQCNESFVTSREMITLEKEQLLIDLVKNSYDIMEKYENAE